MDGCEYMQQFALRVLYSLITQATADSLRGSRFMIHFLNVRVGHEQAYHPFPDFSLARHHAYLLTYSLAILYGWMEIYTAFGSPAVEQPHYKSHRSYTRHR